MPRYILSAEADKIQDLVFRSAHLRQVVGGSQLLTRFCRQEAPRLLAQLRRHQLDGAAIAAVRQDIIVADGGSFTVLFDTPEEAHTYGRLLAQLYYETTGSSLTVAYPVAWGGAAADFSTANVESRRALAAAKRQGRPAAAEAHLPYAAFCSSCGVAPAERYEALHEKEMANYLCRSCREKSRARDQKGIAFLLEFLAAVVGESEEAADWKWPDEAEALTGGWDERRYVAYLVADGNGMGRVFEQCPSPDKLRELSRALGDVLRASLAEPTRQLMARARPYEVPVLPLILGGDDVFALLPAPCALDFARSFCLQYEERMGAKLRELGLCAQPTMAAAVVICKASYPYALAHQHGERLLRHAKRLSKTVAAEHPQAAPHSMVHFDTVLGSRIAGVDTWPGDHRPTLRPYWVVADPSQDLLPTGAGLPLDRLLDGRLDIDPHPQRRLAQLQALFAPDRLPTDDSMARWRASLERVVGRAVERGQEEDAGVLRQVLNYLGGEEHGWYRVRRAGEDYAGHGLPDLLEMWDWSEKLTADPRLYEGKEARR